VEFRTHNDGLCPGITEDILELVARHIRIDRQFDGLCLDEADPPATYSGGLTMRRATL